MTESGPIELMCIDQLSGAEYLCSRLVSAGHPGVFLFEHLLPNRAYNVLFSFAFHSFCRRNRRSQLGTPTQSEAQLIVLVKPFTMECN